MKNILILLFALVAFDAMATCSSPISRTNNSPNTVFTSSKLNSDLNTVYNKVNDLSGDCITDATITNAKIANSTITTAKLATGYKDVAVVTKTSTYTALATDEMILVDATLGAVTINLPTAVGVTGRKLQVKKTDSSANAVTVDANSAETIDDSLTQVLATHNQAIDLYSSGANWKSIIGPTTLPFDIQAVQIGGNSTCTAVCSSSPCNVCNQIGAKITSVTRNGTGDYSLNGINGTTFHCTGTGAGSTTYAPGAHLRATSTSSLARIQFANTSSAVDVGTASIWCIGAN
jgi:hypothetical protein